MILSFLNKGEAVGRAHNPKKHGIPLQIIELCARFCVKRRGRARRKRAGERGEVLAQVEEESNQDQASRKYVPVDGAEATSAGNTI